MKKMLVMVFLLLTGCATSQMVRETDKGGRVVVYGSRSIAASAGEKKAQAQMSAKCPNGYKIVEKGWVTTGQSQVANMSFNEDNQYMDFECN